jgi:hypothetical protein
MTWSTQNYLNELTVETNDVELMQAQEMVELTQLICDDAWLARQAMFGMAGAMERQLQYLGETLLPNTERRVQRLNSDGVIGESYTQDSWFGTTNTDDPHVNEEVKTKDQLIDDSQTFAEQLRARMRTAAIIFVTHVRAHDEISKILEQFTYGQIKQKAEENRTARAKAAVA